MDWVVFVFSRGLCVGFAINPHAVSREPPDNREIPATFPLNPRVSRKESAVVDFVAGFLVQFNG